MNVFQTYITDDDSHELPPLLSERSETIKKLFHNSKHQLYTSSSLRNFIESNYEPAVLEAYDSLIPYSYKSDLGRCCLINKLGGWYFDIGLYTTLKNIAIDTTGVDMVIFSDNQRFTGTIWAAINGCFYSKPDSPVLKKMIQEIVSNCKNKYYGKTPIDPTGPNLFGKVIASLGDSLNIIYGKHEELTSNYIKKNKALVLPDGHILVFCKNGVDADLSSLGGKGVNNYGELWRDRKIYVDKKPPTLIVTKKVSKIPVVYICPDSNEKYSERKVRTHNLLEKMGFQQIKHYKSSSVEYPKCLSSANIDILSNNLDDNPLLVVEDDIAWTGIETVSIPADADCMYVGFSVFAGHHERDINSGSCIVNSMCDNIHRVINMLSTHAIIYISKRFKEATIDCLKKASESGYNTDVMMSRILKNFNVYINNSPIFYQDDETKLENSINTQVEFYRCDDGTVKMRKLRKRDEQVLSCA
jgi:hypothetical protein